MQECCRQGADLQFSYTGSPYSGPKDSFLMEKITTRGDERITILTLCKRYGITKQALYARLRAIALSGTRESKTVVFSDLQVQTLDLVDGLLQLCYPISYIRSRFRVLELFYGDDDGSALMTSRDFSSSKNRQDLILEKSFKFDILLTSRCLERIYNVAPSTVIKWTRVIMTRNYLLARWGKGIWRVYKWNDKMRNDVNREYNLLWVENPPQWFKPSPDQISSWEKTIDEQDEEIRLRTKYGIPLGNGGIYRFFLSKKEQEENEVLVQE